LKDGNKIQNSFGKLLKVWSNTWTIQIWSSSWCSY